MSPDGGGPAPGPDMGPEEFREAARQTAEWAARYREQVDQHPVLARVEPGDVASRLADSPPREGEPLRDILDDVDRVVLPGITHWNHPGFFAYFSSSSSAPALLAEFVAAALGANAMLWRTSPAATEMERRSVDWLRQWVGLPEEFGGVILDTASTSSFTALLAAREGAVPGVRRRGLAGRPDLEVPTAYVSEHAHSSLEKAAVAAGIGRERVRRIPADDRFRMRPGALEEAMEEDRDAGRRPFFVCATVGTTSTTSADPVDPVADLCRRHGAWLHVDAAYAGPAAALPERRDLFEGWGGADSVVINPHKWLFTPMDCSVLLFRDDEAVRRPLALTPEYLSGGEREEGAADLMDYGLPLGRRFRALKLWFLFRFFGADGLRERLRAHLDWTGDFVRWIEDDPRFERTAPAPFSTVCFRARRPGELPDDPAADDAPGEGGRPGRDPGEGGARDPEAANEWNRRLLGEVNREGSVFLSHTVLRDAFTLRLAIGSVHHRRRDVRRAYEELAGAWDRLAAEPGG